MASCASQSIFRESRWWTKPPMPMFSDDGQVVEQAEVLVHDREARLLSLAPADGQVEDLPVHRRESHRRPGAW